VGDEKDPDEADTVGAITLRPEHIKIEGDMVHFDFLGKDSVRWIKTVQAPASAIRNIEEFAKTTPFGKRIAHGLLGMSIGTGLPRNHPPLAILAFLGIREWNFKAPIFIGDTIHMRYTVVEKKETSKKDRGLVIFKRQIINQKGDIVQEGQALLLLLRRQK
jgi:hypothetical protein